jgi:hypothetical protein
MKEIKNKLQRKIKSMYEIHKNNKKANFLEKKKMLIIGEVS